MRGDVLFYRADGGLASRLIVWRTGQPGNWDYVHVAVEDDDGAMIDATSEHGVSRHPLAAAAASWPTSRHSTQARMARGLAFLRAQCGDEYGRLDNLAAALPPWWKLLLTDRDAYDCSHLVTAYLIACGVALGTLAHIPAQRVSPNDLARALLAHPAAAAPAALASVHR